MYTILSLYPTCMVLLARATADPPLPLTHWLSVLQTTSSFRIGLVCVCVFMPVYRDLHTVIYAQLISVNYLMIHLTFSK